MIEARSLTKSFTRGRKALDDVSFTINAGEIAGLLGHNGAGKSTAVGIMLGMVRPDAGEVIIAGHSVQQQRQHALRHVGAIFEAPSFYDYMSGWDNLRALCALSGWWNESEVQEVLQLVNLSQRIHDKVRSYSHGMRQRLALAQALLPMPKVLLLDEPTDGLDPEGIHEFRATILKLRREHHLTILLNSHLLAEVEQMCDRCIILREGRKVYEGPLQAGVAESSRFHLETPDMASARQFSAGWQAMLDERGILTLPAGLSGPEALARLVQAGIRIHAWTPHRRTLEDCYLELNRSTSL